MSNREFFIQHWSAEYAIFLRVFQALPEGQLDYRPHPRSRSAHDLVWLMACEEQAMVEMLEKGQIAWQETAPPKDLRPILDVYQKAHVEVENLLKTIDDKTWEEKKVKFLIDGHVAMETPYADMFWGFLLDAIHHRGQLSAYIRPMGGKVPSIYGPSADDAGT